MNTTKMLYNGKMASGLCRGSNFTLQVEKGKTYDIPQYMVHELLKGGEWNIVKEETLKIPKVKVVKLK